MQSGATIYRSVFALGFSYASGACTEMPGRYMIGSSVLSAPAQWRQSWLSVALADNLFFPSSSLQFDEGVSAYL